MGGPLAILSFCIIFIFPIIILALTSAIREHTKKMAMQLDGIHSRLDILLSTNEIDLGSLPIPKGGSNMRDKLMLLGDRHSALSLIEDHLGVNRKQARSILDRYMSENSINSTASEEAS